MNPIVNHPPYTDVKFKGQFNYFKSNSDDKPTTYNFEFNYDTYLYNRSYKDYFDFKVSP